LDNDAGEAPGVAVRGSRLKIAINVTGTLGLSEALARKGHSFLLARIEIDGVSVGPGPAESAIGLMEKIPHYGDI
jgi:hypothetical protein